MDGSHFDDQLLLNESVLWFGKPQEDAFHRMESRLSDAIMWFILTWASLYGGRTLWLHGLLFPYGDAALVLSGISIAIFIKLLSRHSRSNAGRYWYAVTNKRVLTEFPDEGSQTMTFVNIGDVSKVLLRHVEGDLGTIVIVAGPHSIKRVKFECISNVKHVHDLLKQLT